MAGGRTNVNYAQICTSCAPTDPCSFQLLYVSNNWLQTLNQNEFLNKYSQKECQLRWEIRQAQDSNSKKTSCLKSF